MSETQGSPELTGNMFLFERPELMNKEQHRDLGFCKPEKRFEFCSKARAIPITVTEIPAALKDYPIVFMSKENPILLAVVGLIDDVNLFVDENGEWEKNRYIPGYVRRYPFGLANESDSERMAIVIDTAYEGLQPNGELPLFVNDEPAEMTQSAIEFCKAFEQDRQMTDEFTARLKQFDIIQGQTAHFTPPGQTEQSTFAEYFGIDENKLNGLTDEQYLEVRREGMLAVIYGLVMSMGNWRTMLQRRADRFDLTEAQILDRVIN
jgi:SapC